MNITHGNQILLAGTKYYSLRPNITRGDHILLAETKNYSREWNITRGNVLITRGTEKLLAGTKYYSREYNITRGNELLLAGKNITRGKELLLGGIYLLLAGTIYYSRERNIGSIWHQRASVAFIMWVSYLYNLSWRSLFLLYSLSTGDRRFDRFCRHWRHRGLSQWQLAVVWPWWCCWGLGWRSFVFSVMYICLLYIVYKTMT